MQKGIQRVLHAVFQRALSQGYGAQHGIVYRFKAVTRLFRPCLGNGGSACFKGAVGELFSVEYAVQADLSVVFSGAVIVHAYGYGVGAFFYGIGGA